VRPLLVPVTVTANEPAIPEHDNVEPALEGELLRERLVGEALHPRPFKGETVSERATVPVKPSSPVAIMVVEPVDPASMVTVVEVVDKAKSWIV